MEKLIKVRRQATNRGFSLPLTHRTSLVFLVLSAIIIGSGMYLQFQPDWTLNPDIRAYNIGSMSYAAPPGDLPALPSEKRPAEWPIERAAAEWLKAAILTSDNELKSLALYNMGTLIGREAYANSLAGSAQVEMAEGIANLKESLRLNPNNLDAKYNLELMERVSAIYGQNEGAPGAGYSPGAVEKGY
jgi:hypothetical protein